MCRVRVRALWHHRSRWGYVVTGPLSVLYMTSPRMVQTAAQWLSATVRYQKYNCRAGPINPQKHSPCCFIVPEGWWSQGISQGIAIQVEQLMEKLTVFWGPYLAWYKERRTWLPKHCEFRSDKQLASRPAYITQICFQLNHSSTAFCLRLPHWWYIPDTALCHTCIYSMVKSCLDVWLPSKVDATCETPPFTCETPAKPWCNPTRIK